MDFSRFLQAFLLRDVASYFVPGTFFLAPFILWTPYPSFVDRVRDATDAFGTFPIGAGAAVVAYVVGYLLSSVAYFPWECRAKQAGGSPHIGNEELLKFLRSDYGSIADRRKDELDRPYSDRIVALCYNYVRVHDRETFVMNIERMDSMKNLEVGLSLALLSWVAVPLLSGRSLGTILLAAVAAALAIRLFFFESKVSDAELDEEAISVYLRLHFETACPQESAA